MSPNNQLPSRSTALKKPTGQLGYLGYLGYLEMTKSPSELPGQFRPLPVTCRLWFMAREISLIGYNDTANVDTNSQQMEYGFGKGK